MTDEVKEKKVRNNPIWQEIKKLIAGLQEADGALVCVTRRVGDELNHNLLRINIVNNDVVDAIDNYEDLFLKGLTPRKRRMLQVVKEAKGTGTDLNTRNYE